MLKGIPPIRIFIEENEKKWYFKKKSYFILNVEKKRVFSWKNILILILYFLFLHILFNNINFHYIFI